MSEKIRPQHLARKAMLYVRQSSPYQVIHNVESQKLQLQTRLYFHELLRRGCDGTHRRPPVGWLIAYSIMVGTTDQLTAAIPGSSDNRICSTVSCFGPEVMISARTAVRSEPSMSSRDGFLTRDRDSSSLATPSPRKRLRSLMMLR